MRKVIMICDRCGKEIETLMYGLNVNTVEPGTGDFANERPDISSQLEELDFCQGCIEKIVRYAKGGMKINQEFEAAVQGMTDKESKNEKLANTENIEKPCKVGLSEEQKNEHFFGEKKTPNIFEIDEPVDDDMDPDELDEAREEFNAINKILDEVSSSGKKKKQRIVKDEGPTKREQVWELFNKGLKTKDIAEKLNIASGTVSQYIWLCKQEEKRKVEKSE